MDNKTFLKILKTKSMTFTAQEIMQIMDEELEKDPSEMDTELIDMCVEALERGPVEKPAPKKHSGAAVRKILLVAAIVAAVAGMAIPVSARYVYNDESNKIVSFCADHFNIDLRNGETNAVVYSDRNNALVKELNENGFENVVLPSFILENGEVSYLEDGEDYILSEIKFNNQISGKICIIKYKGKDTAIPIGKSEFSKKYKSTKQLNQNGMDIVVFASSKDACISYMDRNTEYCVVIDNCSMEEAIKIAEF